jgi:hypothetical protein
MSTAAANGYLYKDWCVASGRTGGKVTLPAGVRLDAPGSALEVENQSL